MLFLRSLLYFLVSFALMNVLVLAVLALFWLPLKRRYALLVVWARFSIWWLRVVLNIRLNVIGREHLPTKACVIISNHQSTWETLALQTIFPHQTWVLKKTLLWIPIFGWGLALLAPIVIDRSQKIAALKAVIKQGTRRLKQGIFVVIFPEGTRQPYGKLGQYQNGGAAIARAAGVDLLPIYHNAGRLWAKGSFVKHSGVITLVVGKPICSDHQSAPELMREIKNWTQTQSERY